MQAQYSESNVAVLSSAASDTVSNDQMRAGNFLYQAATVLAILLFLISFWSC